MIGGAKEMSGESIFKTTWNDASEAEATYSRLCVPALLAAFFGLGAFLIYFTLWFFFLGVIAILLGIIALWIIRNGEGTLTGTSLAYFGLCSGIVALVSVAIFWSAYQYGVRQEADQFFRLWFAAVLESDIPRAKEYRAIYSHRSRAASAEEWWEDQYGDRFSHFAIHQYVEDRLIRVLMALGDRATVSHFKTSHVVSERDHDMVASVYAVTFPVEFGRTETFFVRIAGRREFPSGSPDFTAAGWRIEGTPAFYLPEEFR